jgi:hypothetical protein
MRPQFAKAFAFADADGLEDLDVTALLGQHGDADLVDRIDEGRGAAVHDRHFGAVDLDDRIVDAAAGKRRQQVFGGGNRGPVMIAKDGGEFGRGHGAVMGLELAVRLIAAAVAQEYDTGIGFGGMQCEIGGSAGMDANAGYGHMIFQRRLPAGLRAPHHDSVPHLTAKPHGR